jgi:hypothetical protein
VRLLLLGRVYRRGLRSAIRFVFSGVAGGDEEAIVASQVAGEQRRNDGFSADVLVESSPTRSSYRGADRKQPIEFDGVRHRRRGSHQVTSTSIVSGGRHRLLPPR